MANFIKEYREKHGSSVVTVYLPQYIVGHWWESLLHNRRSRRIAQQLMLVHGVTIALVPWLLDSSELIYGRRSRPLPARARRTPVRPDVTERPAVGSSLEWPDGPPRGCTAAAEPTGAWNESTRCLSPGHPRSGHPVPSQSHPA